MSDKIKLTLSVEEETRKRAKYLSIETGMTISDLFALFIARFTGKEIEKIKKQESEKEKK